MTTELISFRLSNADLEWLRENCEQGESLNLGAKRLLLSLINGVNSVDSRANSVDTIDSSTGEIDELKSQNRKMESRFNDLQAQMSEVVSRLEK